jgi:hypothetical protein
MWGFITDRITKDEFKDRFPDAKETNWELLGTGDQAKGWVDGDYITIAEYFCVEVTKVKTATRTITQKKVMWSKLSPLEKLEEREWAGKFIPIVRVVGNEYEVDGKLVISGLVRNSKDACRMFNYWTSQEAEILALAPKAPFIGGKGQFEGFEGKWGSANTVNYPYLEYNPVTEDGVPLPPPQRTAPPLPPAGFMNAKLAAADDIQSTVGQYNPSLGAESKEKSGKAIVARQRQADVGTFHYVDNLGRAVRQVGRIVVDLIPKIYDTQRVARIIGEDGTPDHVTLDPDQQQAVMEIPGEDGGIEKIYNPTIGRYDVRVTTGPSYTTKRQEAAEFMAQVLQGNKELMAVMGDLYFRMLDVPGAEEIAERLKKTLPPNLAQDDDEQEQEPMVQTPQGPIPASQAGQLIVGLMEQNQQAQQSMQTVQQEAQKVHDEATAVDAAKQELIGIQKEIQAAERELALKKALPRSRSRCRSLRRRTASVSRVRRLPKPSKPTRTTARSAADGRHGRSLDCFGSSDGPAKRVTCFRSEDVRPAQRDRVGDGRGRNACSSNQPSGAELNNPTAVTATKGSLMCVSSPSSPATSSPQPVLGCWLPSAICFQNCIAKSLQEMNAGTAGPELCPASLNCRP